MGVLFAVASLAWSWPLLAEDDYLKALQEEAARSTQTAAEEAPRPEPMAPAQTRLLDGDLPPGLDREGFEAALKSGFFGSYMFYQRLPASKREAVHAEYLANPEGGIEAVREAITREGG